MRNPHIPVLLEETVASFRGVKPGVFVDCTVGFGGHSEAVLRRYEGLRLVGIDKDWEALRFSQARLEPFGKRCRFLQGSFAKRYAQAAQEPVSALLADIGVSSLQLDDADRGFGFDSERLDMRMDTDAPLSAYDVVNGYDQERLADIFRRYGEIKQARAVAAAIVRARRDRPVASAKALARIVAEHLPDRAKTRPATLVFQAIRIEVNDELGELERLLDAIEARHYPGQIVSIITFHSLEDRIVKERFKRWARRCICPPEAMRCVCGGDHGKGDASKKPIVASPEEVAQNPRSRSAKLRTFRFRDD